MMAINPATTDPLPSNRHHRDEQGNRMLNHGVGRGRPVVRMSGATVDTGTGTITRTAAEDHRGARGARGVIPGNASLHESVA